MDFTLTKEKPAKLKCDLLAIGCFEDEHEEGAKEVPAKLMKGDGGIDLDRSLGGEISRALKAGTFTGEAGKAKVFYTEGRIAPRHVLVVGLGKKKEADLDTLRAAIAKVAKMADELRLSSAAFVLENKTLAKSAPHTRLQTLIEGMVLGSYSFEVYKDKKKRAQKTLKKVFVICDRQNAATKNALTDGKVVAEATIFARDLGNTPSNDLTPRMLAKFAKDVAAKGKLTYQEMGPAQMLKERMGAFLSVAQGSAEPPAFVHLTYKPKGRSKATVALVGKGVTFDAGGISIKPWRGMNEMKSDMGGAAAVIGTMKAIAQLKPRVTVDAYICAAENMPDGKAIKPGDIVTARNGKTIEYISTDAEGRMLLADGLSYACDKKPDYVIDIATLTGACPYAVGEKYAAVIGTDQKFVNMLIKAGEQSGDPLWQLPLEKSYAKGLTATIADLKNTGSSKADTINGALFLLNFVGETPWAHLDIASNAWTDDATPLCPKGATGSGVRLLTQFLMNM
jgi:leucyl aminopeptidase